MIDTTSRLRDGLTQIAHAFPKMMDDVGMNPDSCVWATRVFLLAAYEAGISARPQAFRLDAASPAWVAHTNEDPEWMNRVATPEEVAELDRRKVRIVTIGHPNHEGTLRPDGRRGFNAHLLPIVADSLLLDLTLHQASRPHYGMPLRPWCQPYDGERVTGYSTPEGAVVRYERVDRADYREAPDWRLVKRTDLEVEALAIALRDMREALNL